MPELEKAYEPQKYEDAIYNAEENSGFFNPDVCVEKDICAKDAKPFSIVLPPPNVTGTLHMGHAVMLAVEDVMVRYHRMKGERTLWVPGTDHAAIATQSKVEKLLFVKEGKTRHDLGREEFLKRVEKFAQESHDTIVHQARKMGASLDWSREAFTLDKERNFAVRTAFKQMYDEGLIYRGARMVNWDPKMQTTVSDDEIEWKEEQAPFYYFQYGPFVIGTSRPETKFGDKHVVMHPKDKRYKQYKDGQQIQLEWINGPVTATIVKDEAVDPEFGSGVMTITPWHDAVDFEIAERHNLPKEQVIGFDGRLLPIAGEFVGMPIEDARMEVVEKLKKKGLLVNVEEKYIHRVATNSRGGGIIEPQVKEQWFVAVNKEFKTKKGKKATLKKLMQDAVTSGGVTILPERMEKTYFHWIDNLRDWCISRQIWYGHQVPVWYKGDEVYCGVEAPQGAGWEQDPDTLDTWFSSGLWTFSTLGWPHTTEDIKTFHPTSVLETGYDILFFWVARMILMSTYLLGEVPFRTVYLHGLVRDEQGRKMSKTLDNIIDPLDMVVKYGTDATRLSLLVGATPGNDVRLSEEKIGGFKNFTNKLWNIARFVLLNIPTPSRTVQIPTELSLADEWILHKLETTRARVSSHLENYNFSMAGEELRNFTWGEFADWYVEIAKIEGNKSEILNVVLNTVLKLWHPFMPFVTSVLWQEMYGKDQLLLVEPWPQELRSKNEQKVGVKQVEQFEVVKEIITGVRSLRGDYKIEPAKKVSVVISAGKQKDLVENSKAIIERLARTEPCEVKEKGVRSASSVSFVVSGVEVFVSLAGIVDVVKEQQRLNKEIVSLEAYIQGVVKKLSNKEFVGNAPADVVEKEQHKLAEAQDKLKKLNEQLKQLS